MFLCYLCSMKLWDNIVSSWNNRRRNHVIRDGVFAYDYGANISKHKFGRTIYTLIVNQLIAIYNEVIWENKNVDTDLFRAWKSFVDIYGLSVLGQLYSKREGYVVIAWKHIADYLGGGYSFWVMQNSEYTTRTKDEETVIVPNDTNVQYYVLRSLLLEEFGISERTLADPFIRKLDNELNASSTISERLGTYVVMSPSADEHTAAMLSPQEKDELEKELQEKYGSLSHQKQIMLLPRGMQSQIVNLAGADQKTTEKVLLDVKVLADLVGVPANQIAIIEASSSKALSNGTELREGDLTKYRNFRKLLNQTFFRMATDIGLNVDYRIENEPKTTQGQTIENL